MHQNRSYHFWLIGILFAILLQGTGCTLLGAGAGALADLPRHTVRGNTRSVDQFESLNGGTSGVLTLTDGTRLTGTIARPPDWPAAECAALYVEAQRQARLSGGDLLPSLGDTLTLVTTFGERFDAQFVGWVDLTTLTVRTLKPAQTRRLPLARVATLRARQGAVLKGRTLDQVMAQGARSSRVLLHNGGHTVVALSRVAHFEVIRAAPKHGYSNGVVTGMVLDLAVLVFIFSY